ncbi:hypothetical protein CRP01_06510 [Flavilitoribacter nigricans DSM 23189 = NBRC 102662]|uniref:Uncharacterized protein n=1 Tax=Flavilitoribacter nigricans (strain ATCC 23147 / DSM 23189 / NBRC 102662 / NCIMB 1420 / SS-2) TaxID=1122177 RepID=A0A2D0NFT9_FLAN2|nr:hypothetical protein CRP01_06510 [Flavilitoribacter nigricans DSM 23189 = NBRC 102662]
MQKEGEVKFFQLFAILEKWDTYDEAQLRKQLKIKTPHQLSNLKRNLYQHILTSLRLIRIKQDLDIQIRELINYAQILYGRGLYLQALRILDKAKTKARDHHQDLLHLEIVEFEKRIESRHITRSTTKRMSGLIEEASKRAKVNSNIVEWSNLKLELQRSFINNGHVRNRKAQEEIAIDYAYCFSSVEVSDLTFFEKVHYHQSQYWLHYLLLDMEKCREVANEWVVLYRKAPKEIDEDVDSYLHALHSLMIAAYYLSDLPTFSATRDQLETFVRQRGKSLNENSRILAFLYTQLAKINHCFISGDLKKSLLLLPKIDAGIKKFQSLLDPHKVHLLYYKIAAIHLANGQPDLCVHYLQPIINAGSHLRDDIIIYARLLLFMAHYEMNNLEVLEYLLASAGRLIQKSKERNRLQKLCLRHFKKLSTAGTYDREKRLREFRAELLPLESAPFLRRAFLYLNVPLWVESLLAKKTMAELSLKKQSV